MLRLYFDGCSVQCLILWNVLSYRSMLQLQWAKLYCEPAAACLNRPRVRFVVKWKAALLQLCSVPYWSYSGKEILLGFIPRDHWGVCARMVTVHFCPPHNKSLDDLELISGTVGGFVQLLRWIAVTVDWPYEQGRRCRRVLGLGLHRRRRR